MTDSRTPGKRTRPNMLDRDRRCHAAMIIDPRSTTDGHDW